MERRKIAVLGAGNGGRAMAAYLSIIGNEVNLYNRTPENVSVIKPLGGIYLRYSPVLEESIFPEGILPSGMKQIDADITHEYERTPITERPFEEDIKSVFARFNNITSNIEVAIKDRDLLMVVVPATGHRFIAEKCAPYLKDGQTILLNPGRFFGAIEFYKTIHDYYKDKNKRMPDITVAEAQTFIYASRRFRPRSVRILGVKNSVGVAAIPSSKTKDVIGLIEKVYPQFSSMDNVLVTSLSNLGGIFHVPITILNATRIYRRVEFEYYIDGVTEHTASIIEALDTERITIAEKIGIKVVSARRWLKTVYNSEGADLYEAIQNTHAYKGIESPHSVNHRYIWEEVPTSLVPLASLGDKLEIQTPLTKSFINQSTALLKKVLNMDFWERGRTMERLGLANMAIDEIKKYVESGAE
jgi:opine dehydrogenase